VNLVWKKKGEERRYLEGIDGAFLVTPFQCDHCWFINLEGRESTPHSFNDTRLLGYIRRTNLDVIWSRAPGTIANVKNGIKHLIRSWNELGMTVDLPALGPWVVGDHVGFNVAIGMLKYAQKAGNNRASHMQFESVRKLRTAYAHLHANARLASDPDATSFKAQKGDLFNITDSPTDSKLFQMFMRGLLLRMGKQTESNWGLDYKVLLALLFNLEQKLTAENVTQEERRECVMLGAFLTIGFVCALRGNEVFMVEAEGLQRMINEGRRDIILENSHVVIPLLGRFKNEDGEKWHLMVAVNTTDSGIKARFWIEKLVELLKGERRGMGPAFCDKDGELLNYWDINNKFVEELEHIQQHQGHLLQPEIKVAMYYSIFRSLRKGSTARAIDKKVDSNVIDLHNRWRTMERTGGQRSTRSMQGYYSDLRLTIITQLAYSRAL
jgi:hypothetical protein